jgi:hypothetical protein
MAGGGLLELDESMDGPMAGERVMWVTAEGELQLACVPLEGNGSSRTDGMPGEMETPALLAQLPLLPNERVLQVFQPTLTSINNPHILCRLMHPFFPFLSPALSETPAKGLNRYTKQQSMGVAPLIPGLV